MVAVGIGFHSLMLYKGRAGNSHPTPNTWPTNVLLALANDKPTVVMFAHPQCPCTKASLGELESLLSKANNRIEAFIIFYRPVESGDVGVFHRIQANREGGISESDARNVPERPSDRTPFESWTNTPSIRIAKAIPGIRLRFDPNGIVSKRFGAETSGHTVVYSPGGHLLFSGGITASRGHLGDNVGFETVLNLVNGNSALVKPTSTPIFGCELFDQCATVQTTKQD